ncbi:protein phosphatase 2C and cyclic nucleotide-binding/kinase domain-containing protein isoform X1 [Oryza glaberrima]|uniref:protein phosphatase 2C and cyclic nucleotide-binding/kinase domain-containing protein isoform X1 n=1 Tax=Oryza glaberrima TaxID=4538 RepID=UPI00224C5806|nr:protein phosphatase 2C and cyclic nucleotide-binding/kinase domain-containing protein isoform X1 [Oryza glaberrima]
MGCSPSKVCSCPHYKGSLCFCDCGCFGQTPDSPRESRGKSNRVRGKTDSSASDASSDDLEEDDDGLHQMNITRDSNVGINRLSRVSSQFLPPEGSRKVRIPLGNYDLRYSYLSQRGYYPESLDKPNQDSFCIHTPFGTSPDDHFFGVFDGHGEYGAQCSQFVKRRLCENLLRDDRFRTDAVQALHSAFLATNSQLHADSLDDSMSGTTAVTVLVRGKTIYIANTGDSRAVIAEKRGEDVVAVDLSIDQTPYRTDELERVKECGARVMTLDQIEGLKNPDVQCWGTEESDDGDPPRLWVQNGMYPGTAFTRSIGDSVAESIGVVANPEIFILELNANHPFFVLASDGVFEFLSSQTVVDMIAKYKDPRDACAAIVAESYRLWLQYETRTDDITIIVVHINGLTDMECTQTVMKVSLQPSQQVVELVGSESPSTISLNPKNQRSRQDLSRARLRALESSLENGRLWVPPSPSHRKTWEEQAHIERILHDHFLFRKLTDSQCHVLLDCMQRVEVKAGDIVVQQGGEGECFYVVGSGEFEVLAIQQEEDGKEVTKVLHRYTADKLSSFGELALMYNKPLQASVRAVTTGTLWALKREDFRGILMSEFSNIPSLKLLRSVELFTRLTILQLSQLADSLVEVTFGDGQMLVDKNDDASSLYIIQRGRVKLKLAADQVNSDAWDLLSSQTKVAQSSREDGNYVFEIDEGGHFGEWALFGETIAFTAMSVGDVTCSTIAKEKFDSIIGPLPKVSQSDSKLKDSLVPKGHGADDSSFRKAQLSDLEWKMCIYAADCSEIGLVQLRGSDKIKSLKRFYIKRVKDLHKEKHVFDEKDLMKSLSQSTCVPEVLCTCADQSYLGILLNCCLCCSLASILHAPLNELSARFYAASVVVALENLHQRSILYRGVSADILMVDRSGHLQLVDFRFAKKLQGERTYTICGIADSLAPEIVLGRGHGFSADWWALGVLIYFMLQSDMPFGSWRESELEPFAKIAKGHLVMPSTFSIEVVDLITKLLEVNENARLGAKGAESVKRHPWFDGIDWKQIADGTYTVPQEITDRVDSYVETLTEDLTASPSMPSEETADQAAPEWIQDW